MLLVWLHLMVWMSPSYQGGFKSLPQPLKPTRLLDLAPNEYPALFKLVAQLTFAMWSHILKSPTWKLSHFAKFTLNLYVTIVLTFLATISRHPTFLASTVAWAALPITLGLLSILAFIENIHWTVVILVPRIWLTAKLGKTAQVVMTYKSHLELVASHCCLTRLVDVGTSEVCICIT